MAKEKKYYETNEFLKLKKEWERKLKESGFGDIEDSDYEDGRLAKQKIEVDASRVLYHNQCLSVLNQDNFKDDIDRFIFTKHCEGIPNKKIVGLLASSGLKPLKATAINDRLLKILRSSGIDPITFNF